MAAELVTPIDYATGIPLPIIQSGHLPLKDPDIADWHHLKHPSTSPILTDTLGGRAMRHSGVQLVSRAEHNDGPDSYHALYKGPELATDETEQFRQTLWLCAGYVPQFGIDMNAGNPKVRRMTALERRFLTLPETRTDVSQVQATFGYRNFKYRYEPVRDFFTDYAMRQQVDINDPMIDEFLTTPDFVRKAHLGQMILLQLTRVATEPLTYEYTKLRRSGRLHHRMPENPARIVLHKLGRVPTRVALLPRLEESLASA